MIIEPTEIHRFEAACRQFISSRVLNSPAARIVRQLAPSMFVASGFLETLRWSDFPRPADVEKRPLWTAYDQHFLFRGPRNEWLLPDPGPFELRAHWGAFRQQDYAKFVSGRRSWTRGPNDELLVDGKEIELAPVSMGVSLEDILEKAWAASEEPPADEALLISHRLWSPGNQRHELEAIRATASRIVASARSETLRLDELGWRRLEEVVAYVLSERGMKVHMVTESPQGGRDLIALGELVPGFDPLTIAVEVKQRRVVNRPEVQMALWQNRHFPALLFVTSGRFSAGVVREQGLPENRLRLHLWDGVTLRRLIEAL